MKTTKFYTMLMLLLVFAVSCNKKDEPNNGGNNNGGLLGDDQVLWVDLGLPSGLLWADRNLGATNPEDYGNYYAWGETSPKNEYSWNTYQYCQGGDPHLLTKYCYETEPFSFGIVDNLSVLESSDDAATVNWGNGARTPTKEDFEELLGYTSEAWTTVNGVNGMKFTGANGDTIFLPAAGYYYDSQFTDNIGYYWSSTLRLNSVPLASEFLKFSADDYIVGFHDRSDGLPVRAVRSAE